MQNFISHRCTKELEIHIVGFYIVRDRVCCALASTEGNPDLLETYRKQLNNKYAREYFEAACLRTSSNMKFGMPCSVDGRTNRER